jgi:hypothetical protein
MMEIKNFIKSRSQAQKLVARFRVAPRYSPEIQSRLPDLQFKAENWAAWVIRTSSVISGRRTEQKRTYLRFSAQWTKIQGRYA